MHENQPAVVILYIVLFLFLVSAAIIFFAFKTRRKIFEKELEKRKLEIDYHRKLGTAVNLAQEKERERIAKDFHDEIGNKLAAVNLNLRVLKSSKISETEKLELIEELIAINKSATEVSRKIVQNLMPPVLEHLGFAEALHILIQSFKNIPEISLVIKDVEFHDAKNEYTLQLYRIIQELLANSIKHSEASKIDISFYKKNGTNFCRYSDNGKGFHYSDQLKNGGFGLKNINSRVDYLNGECSINSGIGSGLEIIFSFKIH